MFQMEFPYILRHASFLNHRLALAAYINHNVSADLDYIPNTARKAEIDLAVSASLGFGGHNACLAFRKVR